MSQRQVKRCRRPPAALCNVEQPDANQPPPCTVAIFDIIAPALCTWTSKGYQKLVRRSSAKAAVFARSRWQDALAQRCSPRLWPLYTAFRQFSFYCPTAGAGRVVGHLRLLSEAPLVLRKGLAAGCGAPRHARLPPPPAKGLCHRPPRRRPAVCGVSGRLPPTSCLFFTRPGCQWRQRPPDFPQGRWQAAQGRRGRRRRR